MTSRKDEGKKKKRFWTESTSRDECKPQTLEERSDNRGHESCSTGLDKDPQEVACFVLVGGVSQWGGCHLHDFWGVLSVYGEGYSEGRVWQTWLVRLCGCETSALSEQHTECCWQGARRPRGDMPHGNTMGSLAATVT